MSNSAAPLPHYRSHHEVVAPQIDADAFRPYWQRRSRLDKLLADGMITLAEWRRATAWRADCERAAAGAVHGTAWLAVPLDRHCRRHAAEPNTARLAALARLRQTAAALGTVACQLLEMALVDELPWAAIGRRFRRDPKTIRSWTVAAIKALAAV